MISRFGDSKMFYICSPELEHWGRCAILAYVFLKKG